MEKEFLNTQAGVATELTACSFEQLFKIYFARLAYFSFQFVNDKAEAEDIVQESFIKYWNQRDQVAKNDIAIKNFLYTAVRNASLNYVRHGKVVQNYLQQQSPQPIEEKDIINSIIQAEVAGQIYQAIQSLPEGCRRISQMSYFDVMNNAEIAETLGISINTVKSQKQRALQLLRLKLSEQSFTCLAIFLLKFL